MEDSDGKTCIKRAKYDEVNMKSESNTWRRPTKIPVCIVEDHCDVRLLLSVGCNKTCSAEVSFVNTCTSGAQ